MGAEKVTDYIAKYIKSTCNISYIKSDIVYKEWENELVKYNETVKEKIRDYAYAVGKEQHNMDREQVLIIEDDADIREGVRILLESENYDVKEAENGKKGLEILSEDTDLVILEYHACRECPGFVPVKKSEKTLMFPYFFLRQKQENPTS